jgi:hypothetical protein
MNVTGQSFPSDDEKKIVSQACSEVWFFERPIVKFSFSRNFRRDTNLVKKRLPEYGPGAVALLIVGSLWIVAAAVFGYAGLIMIDFLNGSAIHDVGSVLLALALLAFLVGMSRLVAGTLSRSKFKARRLS